MIKSIKKHYVDAESDITPDQVIKRINDLYATTYGKCSHYYNFNGLRGGQDNLCDKIIRLMIYAIDNNIILSDYHIEQFYAAITTRSFNSMPCCIQYNTAKIIDFTILLFQKQLPSFNTLNYIVPYTVFNPCFIALKKNGKFPEKSVEYIDYILTKKLSKSNNSPEDIPIFEFVMENFDITISNLLNLCACTNNVIMDKLVNIIDNYEGELNETVAPTFMTAACINLPYTKNVITSLLHKNFQIRDIDFNVVCYQGNIDSLKFILGLGGVVITKTHFKYLLESINNIKNEKSKDKYGRILQKSENKGANEQMKIELFFKYGFVPQIDDIIQTIKYRIEIEKMERFDHIVFDKKLLDLCKEYNFYPSYNFVGSSVEMMQLQKACHEKDFPLIKKLIKNHNLVPSDICMENISNFKENTITEYLMKAGGIITPKCLTNRASNYKGNRFILPMIESYTKDVAEQNDKYKNKILELEQQLENYKKNEVIEEEIKVEPLQDIKYNVVVINVTDQNLIDCRQKYKNKRVPHKMIMDFFGIDKTYKVSHVDFKKLLFEKIKNENWLCEHDKTLICIPIKYRKLFGFNDNLETNVISFNDVDKLIYLFYSTSCE
jgi:hypothetical protein